MVPLQRLIVSALFSLVQHRWGNYAARSIMNHLQGRCADGERFVVGTVISERTQGERERPVLVIGRKRITTIIGKLPAVE